MRIDKYKKRITIKNLFVKTGMLLLLLFLVIVWRFDFSSVFAAEEGSDTTVCVYEDSATNNYYFGQTHPRPLFDWNFDSNTTPDGMDPAEQEHYWLEVDDNSNFSSPEIQVEDATSDTEYQYEGSSLDFYVTYYWRVRVRDSYNSTTTWATTTAYFKEDMNLSGSGSGNYLNYTAYWYPREVVDENYTENMKIRVTIDDKDVKTPNTTLASLSTILDTTDPILGDVPVYVDDSELGDANISFDATTTDSDLYMIYDTNPDLTDGSWEPYNSSGTIDLGYNQDTVYAKFRDHYGNFTLLQSATIPELPGLSIQDTSEPASNDFELFISWDKVSMPVPGFKRYNIYRSDSGNVGTFNTLVGTSDYITRNFYRHDNLNEGQDYYYKITVEDVNGNITARSDPIQGTPNGIIDADESGGGGDEARPITYGVTTEILSPNQVTISWNTDELSNSLVDYGSGDQEVETVVVNRANSESHYLTENIRENEDNSPDPHLTFTSYLHEWPDVDFYWTPEEISAGEEIKFISDSYTYAQGRPEINDACSTSTCDYYWDVSEADATCSSSTASSTLIIFNSQENDDTIRHVVTDEDGYTCASSVDFNVDIMLPDWKEIKVE